MLVNHQAVAASAEVALQMAALVATGTGTCLHRVVPLRKVYFCSRAQASSPLAPAEVFPLALAEVFLASEAQLTAH